jgi:hypothetical protein
VSIKNVQVGERIFDCIRMDIGGMPMRCDLLNGESGARQIRAAKRIADDNQAFFMYDEANAERCRTVLGVTDTAMEPSCDLCGAGGRQQCMDPRCPQKGFAG